MARFKVATFDITNTILKFKRSPAEQYTSIAKQFGIVTNSNDVQLQFKKAFVKHSSQNPNYGAGSIGYVKWWTRVIEDVFYSVDKDINPKLLGSLSGTLIDHFATKEAFEIIPHSLKPIELLKENNAVLGIITNNDERIKNVLKELNLSKYFDFVITSHEANVAKPDPSIFKLAGKLSGLDISNSNTAVHIGDNLVLDYLSARTAGWHSILVSSKFEKQCERENIIPCPESMFKSIDEVNLNLSKFLLC